MATVLGLSLTADDVVWVLIDEANAIVDHDAVEVSSDTHLATAAARGAHSIATSSGHDVRRVHLTWTDDVAEDGLRLRTCLDRMGFDEIEAVSLTDAMAVLVAPDTDPGLALAYGAALAAPSTGPSTGKVPSGQGRPARARTRRRIALGVAAAAAAAVVGGLLLTAGSMPHAEQVASAAAQAGPSDPGWVSVPAPSEAAATMVRKVVDAPESAVEQPESAIDQPVAPIRRAVPEPGAVPAAQPAAAPPVVVPHLPEGEPHLAAVEPVTSGTAGEPVTSGTAGEPAAVPAAEPVAASDEVPAGAQHLPAGEISLGPDTDMTLPANVFTALP